MKFTQEFTVRWHDTDLNRRVSPTGLLTLMQETANLQLEKNGVSSEVLRDQKGVAFILSRLSFDVLAPLAAYQEVEVDTFTCGGRGVGFLRGFEVRREGVTVARAASVWALVRLADRTLVPVADSPIDFGVEQLPETETPLRFRFPRDLTWQAVGMRRVGYGDVDLNRHMNNTRYPNMLCDFLPDPAATPVKGMSLSYLHEAALGETVTVERAPAPDGFYFRTLRADGTVSLEALVRV